MDVRTVREDVSINFHLCNIELQVMSAVRENSRHFYIKKGQRQDVPTLFCCWLRYDGLSLVGSVDNAAVATLVVTASCVG